MYRRNFLQILALSSAAGLYSNLSQAAAVSVDTLPKLEGQLTLYLGRGEGGLYEDVINAIKDRNPKLDLRIRRGSTAALANAITAEAKAGISRADLFWAVDSGAIAMMTKAGLAKKLPEAIVNQAQPQFRFADWVPITGRIRTIAYNTSRLKPEQIPNNILELADSDLSIAWAPSYAAFQSFVTAMRILIGEQQTLEWLQAMNKKAKRYAGELGVVMAVERGEVDVGLANHYYTLRLKSGKPNAELDLAFTNNDAGSLVNASGVVKLTDNPLANDFIRYLLTEQVQSYLASEAYEIPLVENVAPPPGLPDLQTISPPKVDLNKLADFRPTLNLMRKAGVL